MSKSFKSLSLCALLFAQFASADLAETPFRVETGGMNFQASVAVMSPTAEVPSPHMHLQNAANDEQANCLREQGKELSRVLEDRAIYNDFIKMGLAKVSLELTEESSETEVPPSIFFDQLDGLTTMTITIQKAPHTPCSSDQLASTDQIAKQVRSEAKGLISKYDHQNVEGVETLVQELDPSLSRLQLSR